MVPQGWQDPNEATQHGTACPAHTMRHCMLDIRYTDSTREGLQLTRWLHSGLHTRFPGHHHWAGFRSLPSPHRAVPVASRQALSRQALTNLHIARQTLRCPGRTPVTALVGAGGDQRREGTGTQLKWLWRRRKLRSLRGMDIAALVGT